MCNDAHPGFALFARVSAYGRKFPRHRSAAACFYTKIHVKFPPFVDNSRTGRKSILSRHQTLGTWTFVRFPFREASSPSRNTQRLHPFSWSSTPKCVEFNHRWRLQSNGFLQCSCFVPVPIHPNGSNRVDSCSDFVHWGMEIGVSSLMTSFTDLAVRATKFPHSENDILCLCWDTSSTSAESAEEAEDRRLKKPRTESVGTDRWGRVPSRLGPIGDADKDIPWGIYFGVCVGAL